MDPKEQATINQLIHDFRLLDEHGQQAVIMVIELQLQRCMKENKETRKQAFKIVK